jgi:hypothetical protein
MIEPILEKPPPASRIAIDQRGDCTVISLKGAPFAELWPDWLFLVLFITAGLGSAMFWLVSRVGEGPPSEACGFVILAGLWLFIALALGTRLYRRSRCAVFEITHERLTIAAPGVVFFQRLRWRRDRLSAVAAWKGLQIADTSGAVTTLCPYHPLEELAWIAHLLRQLLNVREELPCLLGELPVHYTGSFWDEPVPGVLRVEAGRITLRHPLDPWPHLYFRSAGSARWPGSIPLSESDFNCRVLEHGMMCLCIAPRDVHCRLDHGRPQIRIGLLGWMLSEARISLDAGITAKRRLLAEDRDFHLTIWCQDSDALPRALARFWGSEEALR